MRPEHPVLLAGLLAATRIDRPPGAAVVQRDDATRSVCELIPGEVASHAPGGKPIHIPPSSDKSSARCLYGVARPGAGEPASARLWEAGTKP